MKKFRIFRKRYSANAILYNDVLVDADVQSMLLPLNLMQYIMFCPKYCIKGNIITSNGLVSNFVSLIGTLVFILSSVYRIYEQSSIHKNQDISFTTFMYITAFYNGICYCLGFVINYVNGIIQTNNNVEFVLTFQKMHRFLNNGTSFRRFIIWNWTVVIVALFGYVIFFTYFSVLLNFSFSQIYSCFFIIFFDFNVVYFIRLMKLLEDKVVLWNIQALDSEEKEDAHSEGYCKKMCQAYVDILTCYDIVKICCEQFILYYIVAEMLLHALVNIQEAIDLLQAGMMIDKFNAALKASLILYYWLLKGWTWQTMASHQCEKFYLAVQKAQDSCALILKSNCSDGERKLCKNLLRFHRTSFSKIRVCGLFYLDAALQLSLMSLLTNYTIVLLQFAIL